MSMQLADIQAQMAASQAAQYSLQSQLAAAQQQREQYKNELQRVTKQVRGRACVLVTWSAV
jgi:hypothetical protein